MALAVQSTCGTLVVALQGRMAGDVDNERLDQQPQFPFGPGMTC